MKNQLFLKNFLNARLSICYKKNILASLLVFITFFVNLRRGKGNENSFETHYDPGNA